MTNRITEFMASAFTFRRIMVILTLVVLAVAIHTRDADWLQGTVVFTMIMIFMTNLLADAGNQQDKASLELERLHEVENVMTFKKMDAETNAWLRELNEYRAQLDLELIKPAEYTIKFSPETKQLYEKYKGDLKRGGD